jgi:hypothetical protein
MTRFLPIAAVALLAGSAARAQMYDISNLTPSDATVEVQSFADSFVHSDGRTKDEFSLARDDSPRRIDVPRRIDAAPAVDAAPEFHPAGAIAALTLLLCGVAVLKGWRRE